MRFDNLVHLAVDLQRRFLFPADSGAPQRDIGGQDLLRDIVAFDAVLAGFDLPAIWVVSNARFDKKSGLTLVEPPDAAARQMLRVTYDFPAMLAAELRGAIAFKTANSAFSCPALGKRLRRMQVTTLLVTGLYAGQCIRETVLDAVAAGFYCRIVADLTRDNIPGDTTARRRKRLVELFAHQPQVEITDSDAIIHALRGDDSAQSAAPAIIAPKHENRILMHHFRQESHYSATLRDVAAVGMPMSAILEEPDLAGAFRAIHDEVT
ncbi:MAG: isochorismatase family protein [Alphaproteobacteria bacterium]